MVDHLWPLTFFLPLVFLLIYRHVPKYFVRLSYLNKIQSVTENHRGKIVARRIFPYFLFFPAMMLLILAAADFWLGYYQQGKKFLVHSYVIMNDGSGSMVTNGMPRGVGPQLQSLLAGNKVFLDVLKNAERHADEKDLAAQVLFSNEAYVLSYFRDDYDSLYKKLELVDWQNPPLNGGTNVGPALWCGVQLLLKKNNYLGGRAFSPTEIDWLNSRICGQGTEIKLTDALGQKIGLLKKELNGAVFVIFTDGQFNLAENHSSMIASGKVMNLCQKLGIRIYLISVMDAKDDLRQLIQKTGGSVHIIHNPRDTRKLISIYRKIAEWESGMTIEVNEARKHYYYRWLATPALALLLAWIVVNNTLSRSLTKS